MKSLGYCCPHPECRHTALDVAKRGLRCPNGHFYPYAPTTDIPVFAQAATSNEYTMHDSAKMHDNALAWLFDTFGEAEADLRSRLVSRLRLQPGCSVLITGAGAGNDLPFIATALGNGAIHAQDIAADMLLAAADRYAHLRRDSELCLCFSVSDAAALPFCDHAFDAAYHFGGINLFADIKKGIAEMNRVVKPGGRVVIGDEGIAPWLRRTLFADMLIKNNSLYTFTPPLEHLPETAEDVQLSWELGNSFYVMEFQVGTHPPALNIDIPHLGVRGGSIRTRYYGQLEGISPELRDKAYAAAASKGLSRVEFLESALRGSLKEG